jgi:hypothetical protein
VNLELSFGFRFAARIGAVFPGLKLSVGSVSLLIDVQLYLAGHGIQATRRAPDGGSFLKKLQCCNLGFAIWFQMAGRFGLLLGLDVQYLLVPVRAPKNQPLRRDEQPVEPGLLDCWNEFSRSMRIISH